MNIFLASLIAAIPNVFIAVLSKVVTENFMQVVLEKVLSHGLQKAAKLTTNTLDDEIAAEMIDRLRAK